MIDAFLVIVVLILMAILCIVNLYILAHYSHPLESKFGGSIFAKIIVIVGLLMAETMILLLPLDVSNVHEGGNLDMKGFWYTMTMTSAVFIFLILPIAYFYYETEGDELKSRIWHAVKMEFFLLLISSILLFVSYALLSKANIPIDNISCDMSTTIDNGVLMNLTTETLSEDCGGGSDTFTVEISFAVYFICFLAFIGWWIFVLFVGVGLSALPMDMINSFRNRPRRIDQGEFNRRRTRLLQHVQNLRKDGKHLESIKDSVDKDTGLKGWKNRRFFNRDLTKFEARCLIAEREFVKLERISKISKVEPYWYVFKLILGIVLFLLTIVFIVHIFVWVLVRPGGNPKHPFFNNMLEGMRKGHVQFLSTAVFAGIAVYLLLATIKGNIKFGLRFFCVTFYPIRPNETFLSAFLFNTWLINIWTFSLLEFLTQNFSMYARFTDAYKIFMIQVENMWFYKWFWTSEFFIWVLIVWIVIAFFYLIFKPTERLSFEDQLKNKDLESNRN